MSRVLKVVNWDEYQLSDRHKRRLARQPDPWLPLWIDKWLFGSTRYELTPAERSVWIDLLVMAQKNNGYIMANKLTPYPVPPLAAFLKIPKTLLERTIEKCTSPDIDKLRWVEFAKKDKASGKADTMSGKADARREETKRDKTRREDVPVTFAMDWLKDKAKRGELDVLNKDGSFSVRKLQKIILSKEDADTAFARQVLKHLKGQATPAQAAKGVRDDDSNKE